MSDVATAPSPSRNQLAEDVVPTEELVWRQRVHSILSADDVAPSDTFGSDDGHAQFLADLHGSGHAGTA